MATSARLDFLLVLRVDLLKEPNGESGKHNAEPHQNGGRFPRRNPRLAAAR
jgi:hypothetical protein